MQFAKNFLIRYLSPQRLTVFVCLCGISFAQSSGVWLDVPFVPQEKNGCGAAVIAMVVQYWQHQLPQQDAVADAGQIQRALYSSSAHGIYASDVERYLQEHGFRTFVVKGDWDLLRQHLEKGRPVIVALKPSKGEPSLHYVVVAGLDWSSNLLLVNDPAQKKLLKVERRPFEKEWSAVGRWTLLAVPN
ncbi:MAG TPA: C39 family peptidase [Candidatus Angelobacter sp.]|nr:C39 family peptidase [Candidatus Angelobacter sp.]